VSKVSIPLSSNTRFVSGEFGLVAAKTLEKQCESFNESITWKIIHIQVIIFLEQEIPS
jgi:hypothetical protein